ncbi:MAG TPA: M56 family metallopeptidase [Dehalococcoidia bacterium]|nr:M56 family metallopeptidase [Dehalococcoidia bacterium]
MGSSAPLRCAAGIAILAALVGPSALFGLVTWRTVRRRTKQLKLSIEADPGCREEVLADGPAFTVVPNPAQFAFTLGLKSPRIFVSTAALDSLNQDELRAVITHEECHVRGRDPLRKLVLTSLRSALRFVPGASQLIDDYLRWREYDADEFTVRATGLVRPLQTAFLKLATAPATSPAANFTDYSVARLARMSGDNGARADSSFSQVARPLLVSSATVMALPVLAFVATEWHLILG